MLVDSPSPRQSRSVSWLVRMLCGLVLLVPAVARAHGSLKSSSPAANSVVATVVRMLRLNFSESPALAVTSVVLLDADGQLVPTMAPVYATDSHRSIVVGLANPLPAGRYRVRWRMAGDDGHPVHGEYTFTIAGRNTVTSQTPMGMKGEASGALGAPRAHHGQRSGPLTSMTSDAGGFDASSPVYVGLRWLQFLGLLIVIGAIVFHYGVLGFLRRKEDPDSPMLPVARTQAAVCARLAAVALGGVAVARLYAQSYAMHGSARDAINVTLLGSMITRTVWGWGWLVQIAGVVVAATGFSMARHGVGERGSPRSRLGWAIAAIGVVGLAFTPALSGHAAATTGWQGLAILADGMHVLGAGGWLGSLLLVIGVGIPVALGLPNAQRGAMVSELVNAFSPIALVCAGLAVSTGVFAAWLHLGTVPALWGTHYGRVLLTKLGVLSILAGTGAYNWLKVKPALGDMAAVPHLRRSATVELGVGAVVLLVTAILVATPME